MIDRGTRARAIARAAADEGRWQEVVDAILLLVSDVEHEVDESAFKRGHAAGLVVGRELARDPELEPPPRDFYAGGAVAQPDGHP